MKIVLGSCGHIKARLDNHHNCLKCSSCSKLSTCSTCSSWSEQTWLLAERRRTYSARRPLVTRKRQNKKKRLAINSDLSDDNSFGEPHHRTILPGVTHQGGDYSDAECIQSVSPQVTGQPGTGQPVTSQTGTGQPGTGQFFIGQPVTGHGSLVIQ